MSYRQMNENSMVQFEEQKSLQMLQDQNADDATKVLHIGEVLRKITTVTTKALAQNIGLIKTPQAQVSDINHIFEFLSNCDRTVFGKVRDYIIENKQVAEIQPLKIQCGNCNHEYQQAITLDMSNFFGAAS
jgi:bacterioferritin-associated ferredoxin